MDSALIPNIGARTILAFTSVTGIVPQAYTNRNEMSEEEKIEKLKRLIEIQETDGNYNNSEYMYGLLNGMICALAVFTEDGCEYPPRPKIFTQELELLDKFNNSSIIVEHERD